MGGDPCLRIFLKTPLRTLVSPLSRKRHDSFFPPPYCTPPFFLLHNTISVDCSPPLFSLCFGSAPAPRCFFGAPPHFLLSLFLLFFLFLYTSFSPFCCEESSHRIARPAFLPPPSLLPRLFPQTQTFSLQLVQHNRPPFSFSFSKKSFF